MEYIGLYVVGPTAVAFLLQTNFTIKKIYCIDKKVNNIFSLSLKLIFLQKVTLKTKFSGDFSTL